MPKVFLVFTQIVAVSEGLPARTHVLLQTHVLRLHVALDVLFGCERLRTEGTDEALLAVDLCNRRRPVEILKHNKQAMSDSFDTRGNTAVKI